MRKIYLLFLFAGLFFSTSFAQLPSNSTAEDWTLTDIDGNTHNLYSYLDQGYTVYLDFSATWCAPCWSYHNSGAYENLYEHHGPNGTDEVRVFFIEADLSTGLADLYGNTASTQGDWVTGTPYPIIDLNSPTVANDYNVNYYPTLYAICPDRKVFEMNQMSEPSLDDWINSCNMDSEVTSTSDVQCYGENNGSIDITTTGGEGPQSYDWSNGATTEDLTDLSPDTYSCTVTDAPTAADGGHREVYINDVEIDGPPSPVSTQVDQVNDLLCHGTQNGSIDISVNGGTPGYTYAWSNGATTQDISNLSGGSYTVTVTDNNGCQKEKTVVVEEPPLLTLEIIPEDATCGQNNGTLTLISSGGTGTHLYDIGYGTSTNEYYFDLSPGIYDVLVIDGNGCQEAQSVTIDNIPAPVAEAGINSQLDCSGAAIELDGTGSDQGPNLSYEWSTSDGNIVDGGNTLTPSVDQAGVYELSVTDNNTGCVSVDVVAVIAPPEGPDADAGPSQTLTCGLSEIQLDGSGSAEGDNISYSWDTEDGNIVEGANTLNPIVNEAGTYILTVTNDDSGCSSTSEVTVSLDDSFPEADIAEPGSITCDIGSVMLDASGSEQDSNITYEWRDSEGEVIAQDLTVNVSEAGTYIFYIVNENNGCGHEVEVNVPLDKQSPVIDAGTEAQLTCSESSVRLNGEVELDSNYTVRWSSSDGNIVSGSDSLQPEVDAQGWYFMTVTNEMNGCEATDSVQVTLDEDVPVADIKEPTHLTCEVQSVTLDGSSSSTGSNFEYSWSTEDGNIVSGANTLHPEVDAAGEYILEVTNTNNGCVTSTSVEVNAYLDEPNASYAADGNGFTMEFTDMSQGAPTEWLWEFGDGSTSEVQNPTHVFPGPGTYMVCLTAVNDCGEQTICRTVHVSYATEGEYETDREPCVDCPFSGNSRQRINEKLFGGMSVYPNPTAAFVYIRNQWEHEHHVTLQLKNAVGRTYRTIERNTDVIDVTIDMRSLPAGMYLIGIEVDGEMRYRSVMKQ